MSQEKNNPPARTMLSCNTRSFSARWDTRQSANGIPGNTGQHGQHRGPPKLTHGGVTEPKLRGALHAAAHLHRERLRVHVLDDAVVPLHAFLHLDQLKPAEAPGGAEDG